MLKREWGAESNEKLPHLVKLQPRFLSLEWKTCLWAELQPWFLSMQWRTCPWAEHWWCLLWGRRVIGISGSLIWSKTLMELIFNPCGEFRWGPDGPIRQIHSPHLYVGVPGIFSDAKQSVGMRKATGSYRAYSSPGKLLPWFLSLRWKTCHWQNWSVGSCACSEGPATLDRTLWWWWLYYLINMEILLKICP